jgi:hypothetical protein
MCAGYYIATLLASNKLQFMMNKILHAEQKISILSPLNEYKPNIMLTMLIGDFYSTVKAIVKSIEKLAKE